MEVQSKSLFLGVIYVYTTRIYTEGLTPRSVTILTLSLKYLREPRKRCRLPYVVCTRRGITKKILLHPYFLYKNIFVALSLIGVVFIRGLSEDTTEDGLCSYLENTRRLGDGPV